MSETMLLAQPINVGGRTPAFLIELALPGQPWGQRLAIYEDSGETITLYRQYVITRPNTGTPYPIHDYVLIFDRHRLYALVGGVAPFTVAALYYNLMRMVHDNPEQALNVLIE